MKVEIIKTEDGSNTLYVPDLNENYHSINGAIQESMHVYINTGLRGSKKVDVKILEIGFGTGLNALLSYIEAQKTNINIVYHSIEKYPLGNEIVGKLNFPDILGSQYRPIFSKFHSNAWDTDLNISNFFQLKKINADINNYEIPSRYDMVYFDAFAPEVQPEIWSERNFKKIKEAMNRGGILTTYSSKSIVRRKLRNVGFKVEKLPGPPGKREIIRAIVQ